MRGTSAIGALVILFLAISTSLTQGSPGDELIKFVITYPSISPNGDSIQDSTSIEITVLRPCDTLAVTVEDAITSEVLNTLLSAANPPDTVVFCAGWSGQDSFGVLLDEGSYKMHIMASRNDTIEHYNRTVIVDITAPMIQLDRIEPGIFTPGIAGAAEKVLIYFIVTNFHEGDSTILKVTKPSGTSSEYIPADVTGDGSYVREWSTSDSSPDGIYTLTLSMQDEAGNSSQDVGYIDVDTEEPQLSFIDPIPEKTNEVATVQEGSCYDRSGVESPDLIWNGGAPFSPDSTYMRGDTLIWQLEIIDSVTSGDDYVEGTYTLEVVCRDVFGRESQDQMSFTIDTTPPDPPVINQPASPVDEPEISITGHVEYPDADEVVVYRVFQGDTVSSSKDVISDTFAKTVELGEGTNEIWAEALDEAGNRSDPSNRVTVIYEEKTHVSYPEAFRGPDVFSITTESQARGVEINILTLNGEHVTTLYEPGPATKFEIPWNLLNDDGEQVRNGAYLLVITVLYNSSKSVDKSFIAVVR